MRAVADRELGHPGDTWLLQLERMRILDTLHSWSEGTTRQYQSKLKKILAFERAHPGVHSLIPPGVDKPVHGPEIGLMWAELDASVQIIEPRGRRTKSTPAFTTIRQIRSAASQFMGWNLITSTPGGSLYFQDRRLLFGETRPTDGAVYELFSRGLQARLGNESTPSTALLGRHIRALDKYFETCYLGLAPGHDRDNYALAGLANLVLWLSWLRGGECFQLNWEDFHIIWPSESARYDIHPCGALLLQLLPETKSERSLKVDILIALQTITGLNIHKWLCRVLAMHRTTPRPNDPVFAAPGGNPGTPTGTARHTCTQD